MKDTAIRPAVISAPGKPSIHLGIRLRARRSRMPAISSRAKVKHSAALQPLRVLSSRL